MKTKLIQPSGQNGKWDPTNRQIHHKSFIKKKTGVVYCLRYPQTHVWQHFFGCYRLFHFFLQSPCVLEKNPRIRLILWMEETPHQFVNALSHYFPLLHSHLHSFQLVQDSLIFSYMEVSQVMGLPPIMIRFFWIFHEFNHPDIGASPLNHH